MSEFIDLDISSRPCKESVAKICAPYKKGLITIPAGNGLTSVALHLLVNKGFVVSIVVGSPFCVDLIANILTSKKEGGPWTLSTKSTSSVLVVTSPTQIVAIVSRHWLTENYTHLFNKLVNTTNDETVKIRMNNHGRINGIIVIDNVSSLSSSLKGLFSCASEGWAFNQGDLIFKDRDEFLSLPKFDVIVRAR